MHRVWLAVRLRLMFDVHEREERRADEEHVERRAGGDHARSRADAFEHLLDEARAIAFSGVGARTEANLRGHHTRRVESGIDLGGLQQRPDNQRARRQQHEGHGGLRDDQCGSGARRRPSADRPPAAAGEIRGDLRSRKSQYRTGHRDDHDRRCRNDRGDPDAPVDVDRISGERIRRIECEERRHQQRGAAQSRGGADHGDDHRLHHFGRGDFRARCAQRGAHGEIAAAEHHVGQGQVGEIGDGQEGETNDGGQQHQHGVALRAVARFPEVEHAVAPAPFEDRRPLVLDRREQRGHLAFGLRRRDAGPEDAHALYERRSLALDRAQMQRCPELGAGEGRIEAGADHADDRVRFAVDHQRAADDGQVAAEAPLPVAVTQHRHLHIVGDFLLGEDAAGARLAAERREEAGGDAAGRDAFRLAVAGDRAIGDPDALESFEAPDPLAEAHEGERIVWRRAREGRRAGRLHVEPDQAIRIGKGQRTQEDRVGDRQHRADRGDDHGDRQDAAEREARLLEEHAPRDARVSDRGSGHASRYG